MRETRNFIIRVIILFIISLFIAFYHNKHETITLEILIVRQDLEMYQRINKSFSKQNLFITVFATNNHSKEPYNFSENVCIIPALKTDDDDDDLYARKSFLN